MEVIKLVDWGRVYRLLNDVTPLSVDCGRLCGAVCCSEWEKGVGMYLLPGEETMFTMAEEWLVWEEHSTKDYDFCPNWSGIVFFVRCNGTCPRDKRPFACRTFPLSPYLSESGSFELRLEEGAALLCPLVRAGDIELLDRRFLARARLAWEELLEDPRVRDDVLWGSRRLDRLAGDSWKKLLYKNKM